MKKILLFALCPCILFVCCISYAQQTTRWHLQSEIFEDSVDASLYFPDSLHGYCFCSKMDFYNKYPQGFNDINSLYRTMDGGSHWEKINFYNIFREDTSWYSYPGQGYSYKLFVPSPNSCVMFVDINIPPHDTLRFYWSQDNGTTWYSRQTTPIVSPGDLSIEAVPQDHDVIGLRINDKLNDESTGKLFFSPDNGETISDLRWDSTLLKNLSLDGYKSGKFNSVNNHSFDYFNNSTWIINVADSNNAPSFPHDTSGRPYSMVSLLTNDTGHSWQAFRNNFSYFPSDNQSLFAYLKCIRGTSYVYGIAPIGLAGIGNKWLGVNYVFSSDYGKSWQVDTSYRNNRKAITPLTPGEVWCTVTPHDSVQDFVPAHWITHTRDNGKNWGVDSTSLYNDGFYDGRQIVFSDTMHGWIFAQRMDRHSVAIFKYDPPKRNSVSNDLFKWDETNYTLNPNPAFDETTIHLTNGLTMSGIEFFDILGRKQICPTKISDDYTSVNIHTSGLSTGCYLAHLSLQNANYVVPFVVQH